MTLTFYDEPGTLPEGVRLVSSTTHWEPDPLGIFDAKVSGVSVYVDSRAPKTGNRAARRKK